MFKWSGDDHYLARVTPGQAISVYETPGMGLLDKKSIKIEGVVDFEWCPLSENERDAILEARHLLPSASFDEPTFTTPRYIGNQTVIMSASKQAFPVDVIEIKDTVTAFAWEPKGNRFVLITSNDPNLSQGPAPGTTIKTSIHFFGMDVKKGDFRLFRSSSKFDLEFWDTDLDESDKDLGSGISLLSSVEHYGMTELEWDPSGRYLATIGSMWLSSPESGYAIWDFKGELMHKATLERFKQLLWRSRPRSLLSKETQRKIRKNLREYSKQFEEEDQLEASNKITRRMGLLETSLKQELASQAARIGKLLPHQSQDDPADSEQIEDWIEEVIEETETMANQAGDQRPPSDRTNTLFAANCIKTSFVHIHTSFLPALRDQLADLLVWFNVTHPVAKCNLDYHETLEIIQNLDNALNRIIISVSILVHYPTRPDSNCDSEAGHMKSYRLLNETQHQSVDSQKYTITYYAPYVHIDDGRNAASAEHDDQSDAHTDEELRTRLDDTRLLSNTGEDSNRRTDTESDSQSDTESDSQSDHERDTESEDDSDVYSDDESVIYTDDELNAHPDDGQHPKTQRADNQSWREGTQIIENTIEKLVRQINIGTSEVDRTPRSREENQVTGPHATEEKIAEKLRWIKLAQSIIPLLKVTRVYMNKLSHTRTSDQSITINDRMMNSDQIMSLKTKFESLPGTLGRDYRFGFMMSGFQFIEAKDSVKKLIIPPVDPARNPLFADFETLSSWHQLFEVQSGLALCNFQTKYEAVLG
ncbi:hypothetical protein H4Q26_008872 [Puccinia striiformis f. sp. tritici PST-130]|nr:hypothetical protein H4Q26_008872 [Puccinia striiformis f. sp. tritici PST-130]